MKNYVQRLLIGVSMIMSLQGFQAHITIVIPSYNNASYYNNNLDSVLYQNYHNYNVIYIDDASTDGTGDLVEKYIQKNQLGQKWHLIKNTYNRRALANIFKAIYLCDDDDLIVILDGDDWFAHSNVLSYINDLFQKEDILMAYAQYKNVPERVARKQRIKCQAFPTPDHLVDSSNYRSFPGWCWSGLRMFYAGLFKQIKVQDFIFPYEPHYGRFFPTSYDGAIMYPMLEMCGDRFTFIPEVLLHRNVDTPLNDFKVNKHLQVLCGKALNVLPKYKVLEKVRRKKEQKQKDAELILTINSNKDLIDSKKKIDLSSFSKVHIIQNSQGFTLRKSLIGKNVTLQCIDESHSLLDRLKKIADNSRARYFMIADAQSLVPFSVNVALDWLQNINAFCVVCNDRLVKSEIDLPQMPIEHLQENFFFFCSDYKKLHISKGFTGLFKADDVRYVLNGTQSQQEFLQKIYSYFHEKNNIAIVAA